MGTSDHASVGLAVFVINVRNSKYCKFVMPKIHNVTG